MAFGDVLRHNIRRLETADESKASNNAFWLILRNIAREEIIEMYPHKVDSDVAVEVYYLILKENEGHIPEHFREKLPCNNQERYRVINRNLWTSNAFHPDGLANQRGICATKQINPDRKGSRIVYQGAEEYVG